MQQRIAFDPKFGLSATEFVEAWNAHPPGKDGRAVVNEDFGKTFLSPEISMALITAAVSIPATVIASFVSEYLKSKFIENEAPRVSTTRITTPEGESLLIIRRSEE